MASRPAAASAAMRSRASACTCVSTGPSSGATSYHFRQAPPTSSVCDERKRLAAWRYSAGSAPARSSVLGVVVSGMSQAYPRNRADSALYLCLTLPMLAPTSRLLTLLELLQASPAITGTEIAQPLDIGPRHVGRY